MIVGGWSSAPYGTRIVKEAGIDTKRVFLRYRAVSLWGPSLPSTDQEAFLKSTEHIGCFDSVTFGDGPVGGKTVLDVGFSNVNPTLHCPGTILGAAVMENYGRVFGGNDKSDFSIYSHVYTESVSAVQYSFYQEEIELAKRSVSTSLGTPRKPSIHALTS
ncbi:NAD/NADP octopine/nopaline dehydrogenase family protein [Limosilactobacillus fermentum]|uniref:NAD/NADP octopine/nopaline dehydrogenase family protein n=1 Tax=Limosilactobacillus fermentum TaxID=1613 RepID=UPI00237A97D9|nr:NAD/NADP octopine/nopaline dehydrogenase family protein [Limosilactobacillus fermentum]